MKGKLYNNTKVLVLEKSGKWAFVRTPAGYTGWVSSAYLAPLPPVSEAPKPAEPTPAPTPPPAPELVPTTGIYPPGQARWSEDWCLPMMKKVEGLRLEAYYDAPGWAIGYGHNSTSKLDPIPYKGMTIPNEKAAEDILRIDLNECVRYINAWVKVDLNQPQVDALCMHIFQQGPTQFRSRVLPTVNTGNHLATARIIRDMSHANPGVERRRRFEAARYLGSSSTTW